MVAASAASDTTTAGGGGGGGDWMREPTLTTQPANAKVVEVRMETRTSLTPVFIIVASTWIFFCLFNSTKLKVGG